MLFDTCTKNTHFSLYILRVLAHFPRTSHAVNSVWLLGKNCSFSVVFKLSSASGTYLLLPLKSTCLNSEVTSGRFKRYDPPTFSYYSDNSSASIAPRAAILHLLLLGPVAYNNFILFFLYSILLFTYGMCTLY